MFLAVAFNESRFTEDAVHVNKNGTIDRGLCQINDSCFSFLYNKGLIDNKEQLFDAYRNIDCYIRLMKYHLDYTQNEDLALLRYQVGAGRYAKQLSQQQEKIYKTVLGYKDYFTSYMKTNPSEIFDLYTPDNFSYLYRQYPEHKDVLVSCFISSEWQGRYR